MGWVPQLDGDMVILRGKVVDSDGWRFCVFWYWERDGRGRELTYMATYLPQD